MSGAKPAASAASGSSVRPMQIAALGWTGPAGEQHRRRGREASPPGNDLLDRDVARAVEHDAERPVVVVGEQEDDAAGEVGVSKGR